MKKLSVLMLMACCSSGQVLAQDSGWFATGQFGVADYDTTLKGSTGFFGDVDDESFAWALGIGYDFHRNFSIRGMFERSTDHSTVNVCPPGRACFAVFIEDDTEFNNWSLVAMPRLPLGSRASLYGTIGLQYWDAENGRRLPDDEDFEFLFGGGLEYELTRRLSIGGEVQGSAADYVGARFVINLAF